MVNNSVPQSTLTLVSVQSFYSERAWVGCGDSPPWCCPGLTPSPIPATVESEPEDCVQCGRAWGHHSDPTAQVALLLPGRRPWRYCFLL